VLAADVLREHAFLVPVGADKVASLQSTLTQLMPPASVAKYKPATGGSDVFAFLQSPPVTAQVLQHVTSAPASARAPYLLSWLPQHFPCLLLILRDSVYAVFGPSADLWFLVPNLSFPKRKAPADRVNNTLLLGELIRDIVHGPAAGAPPVVQSRLLVTDLLIMSQTLLLTLMPLEQRLTTMDAELIQPLKALLATLPTAAQPELHIRGKAHFQLSKVESVLRMSVPHVHQGLTLRMSGKDKDAAKSVGFHFAWRKDAPDVSEADLLKLATVKR